MTISINEAFIMKPKKNKSFAFDIYDSDGNVLDQESFQKKFAKDLTSMEGVEPHGFLPLPKVCAEGDSWLNILWPLSKVAGHEKTLFDVIQGSGKYQTLDLAWPGDTLKEILEKESYRAPLGSAEFDHFIFSAAGNDVIGSGALVNFLKRRDQIDPSQPVETWLQTDNYQNVLNFVEDSYMDVAQNTNTWSGGRTNMLIHGYDYPIPRDGGEWFGTPLNGLGYNLSNDAQTIRKLIEFLVDNLYLLLGRVELAYPHVKLIDCRNIVQGRWNDELHPEKEASADLATLFINEMSPSS